jgi:hypothetical protein
VFKHILSDYQIECFVRERLMLQVLSLNYTNRTVVWLATLPFWVKLRRQIIDALAGEAPTDKVFTGGTLVNGKRAPIWKVLINDSKQGEVTWAAPARIALQSISKIRSGG